MEVLTLSLFLFLQSNVTQVVFAPSGVSFGVADATHSWPHDNYVDTEGGIYDLDDNVGSNDLQQTNSLRRPVLATCNTTDDCADFDGTGNYFESTTDPWSTALTQPYTVFLYAQSDKDVNHLIFGADTGATDEAYFYYRTSTLNVWIANAGNSLNSNATIDFNEHVFAVKYDGTSSEIWIDCQKDATGNAGTDDMDSLRLGSWSGNNQPMYGWIGDVWIYQGIITDQNIIDGSLELCSTYGMTCTGCG